MSNQNQKREYRQVSGGGSDNPRWEPTKNEGNPNYPKQIEGYFKDVREINGSNGPFNVGEIQLVNTDGSLGNVIGVSGGKVLDEALDKLTLGAFVCIKYGGKIQSKAGGRSYNSWEVFVDDNAVPFHQLGGAMAQKQQPVQNPVQQPVFNQQAQNNNNGQFGGQQQNQNPFPQNNNNAAPIFNTGQAQNNPVQQPNVQKTQWNPQQQNNVNQGQQNNNQNPFPQNNNPFPQSEELPF